MHLSNKVKCVSCKTYARLFAEKSYNPTMEKKKTVFINGWSILFIGVVIAILIIFSAFKQVNRKDTYIPGLQQVQSSVTPSPNPITQPLLSKDGDWRWDYSKNDWVPNTKSSIPSERALKAASRVMVYANTSEKKQFMTNYAGTNGKEPDAIKNFALFLDDKPEQLVFVETSLEKYMSSTVTNYTKPSEPATTSLHCTSNQNSYTGQITTNCN